MKIESAANLALANILHEGLDDVLPAPFELELLKADTQLQQNLIRHTVRKIGSGTIEGLSVSPLHHVLVPKKDAFDYRRIAIIRIEDLMVYQTLAFSLADTFEAARRATVRGRVHSYRFRPTVRKGRPFDPKYNIRSFQAQSGKKSKRNKKFIVKSDISNFYDRINIHRVESALLSIPGVDRRNATLLNRLLLHWARRDSYGLPIGSNASRVLAEVALFAADAALKAADVDFLRFVDDYRIFVDTAAGAHAALNRLINLLSREGLFINARKTLLDRVEKQGDEENGQALHQPTGDRIEFNEFRIIGGYGGDIPLRFRKPTKNANAKYLSVNLKDLTLQIEQTDFAHAEQIKHLIYGSLIQNELTIFHKITQYIDKFPQFYPLVCDMLVKNEDSLPDTLCSEISDLMANRLGDRESLPEYIAIAIAKLLAVGKYKNSDALMSCLRAMRRTDGVYFGSGLLDALYCIESRHEALEIREYFDRSNEWEKRRIIRIVKKCLPREEYDAWLRAIRPYIAQDLFAVAVSK